MTAECRYCGASVRFFGDICRDCGGVAEDDGLYKLTMRDIAMMIERMEES